MTFEIGLIFALLALAVVLFVTEALRPDLVALLVLSVLAVSGLLTPAEALAGFSNPAVITIWAMFIMSGGLAATGVADRLGEQILRLAGQSEVRLLAVIMLTAALLSAFMNSTGVAALLLPVIIAVARQTGHPPSRLLLPMAYATLFGGLTTLIGTAPNLLASQALQEAGLEPFSFFAFTPVGLSVLLAGTAFMVLAGRHLLPHRAPLQTARPRDLRAFYSLEERLQVLRIPAGSHLAGRTLAESRLGGLLGLNVVGLLRGGQVELAPDAGLRLEGEDRLLVVGRAERLAEIRERRLLDIRPVTPEESSRAAAGLRCAVAELPPGSPLAGQTLPTADLRRRFRINVIAIKRQNALFRGDQALLDVTLAAGDRLTVCGAAEAIDELAAAAGLDLAERIPPPAWFLAELVAIDVPAGSPLAGRSPAESHLGSSADLTLLGALSGQRFRPEIPPAGPLEPGERLLGHMNRESYAAWSAVAGLAFEEKPAGPIPLETEHVGFVEATLSPYAAIEGKTLRQLHFRQKYNLTAVAIWRDGRAYRHQVRDMPLRLGDGLLLYGPRSAWPVVAADPNFILLELDVRPPPRRRKAGLAVGILGLVLLPVLLNWLPLAVAAVLGAALMIAAGCLTMEEAYRYIEWKAVFLIAGMLPLGTAIQVSGGADYLAGGVITLLGGWGALAILSGLFLITHLAAQLMPNAVVVVLMAPIALRTAVELGVSPYPFVMGVALAAAASLLSPVGHTANVLVMGPGGYRFVDYVKVGLPLTLIVLAIALGLLPLVWPL